MGAWGPGIFADDETVDVRDNFKFYVADQQDIGAATEAIAWDHGASLDHPEHHTAFWLALALTQWAAGWLDVRVKTAALRVIDRGDDLAKWRKGPDQRRRAAALRTARERLSTPPPSPKPFPRPWPTQLADYRIGEVIGRRLLDGRLVVMKVIAFRPTQALKVRGPAVRVQHWLGARMPNPEEAACLAHLRHPLAPTKRQTIGAFVLTAPRSAPLDPDLFIRTGLVVPVGSQERSTGYSSVSAWPYTLDELLTAAMERFWADSDLPSTAMPPWHHPGEPLAR